MFEEPSRSKPDRGRQRLSAARAIRWRFRRPSRYSIEVALKSGVGAAMAIWVAQRLDLADSYWAGISAVVATAGTLGASVRASFSRIAATTVGLAVGLGVFASGAGGVVVEGATVFAALVVLAMLSLDAGSRLGAATTLIVTATPNQHAVADALGRGANVPLGCAVAVVIGLVLFPHRAARRLRIEVHAELERAGTLAQSAITAYLGRSSTDELPARLHELVQMESGRAAGLSDASREPGVRGERLLQLRRDLAIAAAVVDDIHTLVVLAREGHRDRAPQLVGDELQAAGEAFAGAARAIAASADGDDLDARIEHLTVSIWSVQAAFALARERRATAEFSTEELARLMSVMHTLHKAASALPRFRRLEQDRERVP
jgi:uncharacterized membrane protein YccC